MAYEAKSAGSVPGPSLSEAGPAPDWPPVGPGHETLRWIRALASAWEDERSRGEAVSPGPPPER